MHNKWKMVDSKRAPMSFLKLRKRKITIKRIIISQIKDIIGAIKAIISITIR